MLGVIQFNQEAWLKPYMDMNTWLGEAKHELEKDVFKLMNNSVFGKTMKIIEKHRDMDTDSFIIHIKNYCRWCWKKLWYIKLWSW